ncbi:hypothetical protein ACNSOP_02330 [Aliarcobacter lanthieri]|uniref:hypothetical protein n=1 Tax=Aliarcobacter lanthieri TaxID=1355374 RepID=UPI003AA7C9D3
MENNLIHKFEYTKNPYKAIYLDFLMKIFLFIILAVFLLLTYKNSNFEILKILLYFYFVINIFLSILYSPIIYRINKYKSFEIYKNKLVINKKSYLLNEISYKINEFNPNLPKMNLYWKSIQFFDKNNKKIGEFFFFISIENDLANITLKTLTKIIDDLKNSADYDYKDIIHTQLKEYKKGFNFHTYEKYFIILFIIPLLIIALLIFLFKN